ncbi:hypothetical protein [Pseudomonas sp. Q11]|uniref:hypothetical protein n=1 Tax=Pseudomonas sp. Q11 TaxID=2968470 RepID=UPI002109D4A4|nr:hypothetical protein [Pseudomonas sp. Q11]MCQ6256688.1 hypothetical protein [Pseudomonas sp. Q11]
MSEVAAIRNLVMQSARTLEAAVKHHWPVVNPERNGLQESNLTIHFAARALQEGLHVYPEASNHNTVEGHSRVDLLVKGSLAGTELTILVESKKLFSAGKAAEMHADYWKMCEFVYARTQDANLEQKIHALRFGLLLAVTASVQNKDWWIEPYPYDGKSWDALAGVLAKACDKGSYEIAGLYPQHILYAVFQL